MKSFDNYECDFIKRRTWRATLFIKVSSEIKMFNTFILFYLLKFHLGMIFNVVYKDIAYFLISFFLLSCIAALTVRAD